MTLQYTLIEFSIKHFVLFIKLIQLFLPKRKRSVQELVNLRRDLANVLLERYTHDYFVETFGIPFDQVNDFVFFTEENGLTASMLKPANEIELLAYLFEQSETYKKRLADRD